LLRVRMTCSAGGAPAGPKNEDHSCRRGAGVTKLILIAFLAYAAVFIYRTSFVIDGHRYFCLFDDEMVSMRYAQNLASGNGLVWNPGEKVEGFTNPLWVLLMAFFHLFGIAASRISLL